MPLPNQIPVRYTDEDAGHISVRPVINQTFQLHELLDMVVSVAGKDAARIQQIFRSGTVVYNGYRYWTPSPPIAKNSTASCSPSPTTIPRAPSIPPKPPPSASKSAAAPNAPL